ncbi:hypothetical protein BHD05_04145 [Marisediminicola antarctica]|uniref:Uncharacterized protein n=1 Tax=Marisediminicola antarctica TaxID=674079 RepID=A0A7L5AG41_9MICO|nr:hypothetical protein BHD05_04145 [Marisediminicola antarctica]
MFRRTISRRFLAHQSIAFVARMGQQTRSVYSSMGFRVLTFWRLLATHGSWIRETFLADTSAVKFTVEHFTVESKCRP